MASIRNLVKCSPCQPAPDCRQDFSRNNYFETTRPLIDQHNHELTVSLPPDPVWLDADVHQEGDQAMLRVRDTGLGIAPAFLPHVFDLFAKAERSPDRSQVGLGIGSALVKRVVEMHGGTVQVPNTLGQGSEFVGRLAVHLHPPETVRDLVEQVRTHLLELRLIRKRLPTPSADSTKKYLAGCSRSCSNAVADWVGFVTMRWRELRISPAIFLSKKDSRNRR